MGRWLGAGCGGGGEGYRSWSFVGLGDSGMVVEARGISSSYKCILFYCIIFVVVSFNYLNFFFFFICRYSYKT